MHENAQIFRPMDAAFDLTHQYTTESFLEQSVSKKIDEILPPGIANRWRRDPNSEYPSSDARAHESYICTQEVVRTSSDKMYRNTTPQIYKDALRSRRFHFFESDRKSPMRSKERVVVRRDKWFD